ncbi:hypothetical protein NKI38_26155 [Mesorhizobium sp. M0621]|uniref:hypothetical protein n=1 Tax=Mesorhizobium sp. M0621 TaxID=2956974 RepID=UPI00333D6990
MERRLQLAMALRYHLSDRNDKKLKQGLRRTMMTRLAVAKAVMHLLGKRVMRVQDPTVAKNMSRPIQPAILGATEIFQGIIKRLPHAERVGTAFAN